MDHDPCKTALEAAAKRVEELERENAELRKRPSEEEVRAVLDDYDVAVPLYAVRARLRELFAKKAQT